MKWEPRDLPENNVTDVHPLRELIVLLAGIGLATVVLTLALALVIDGIVRVLPPEWEARAFSGLWSDLDTTGDPRTSWFPLCHSLIFGARAACRCRPIGRNQGGSGCAD